MPIQPSDLLQLAADLSASGAPSECLKRCVVSRAYYAALHAVDDTFEARGPRINGESSHAEIISRAQVYSKGANPGRSDARSIANELPRLRRFRNHADYHLDTDFDEKAYTDVVARARRVITLCSDVQRLRDGAQQSAAPAPAQAAAAIGTIDPVDTPPPSPPQRPGLRRIK